jgi:hypothetical protein
MQQKIFPSAHRSRVDVLVTAEPRKAIGKGDDDRRHALFTDQPVEPFRQVLAKTSPVGMRQVAASEADKIDQQWQSLSVMPGQDVYIDDAHCRIAQHIIFEEFTLDSGSANRTGRPEKFTHTVPHRSDSILVAPYRIADIE